MSVTGNKGRDKSSMGCFRCQAHSVCVCLCVCHRGGYKLTQSGWAPAKLHDSLQRAGSYRAASRTDLKRFQSEKSWDVLCSAQENLFQEQLPGHGEGARISSASHKARQGEGKHGGDVSAPTGLPVLPQTCLFSLQSITAALGLRAGGQWGAHELAHTSGSLSTASGSLWMPSRVCFRTGCSFNMNLSQPQLCAGGRATGGHEEGEGEVFFLGERQAEIDTPCHFFWQERGVLGGLEVRGARSSPGSLLVFLATQLF